MRRLRQFVTRLLGYARRGRVERDLDAEIRAHLDLATDEHVRAGLPPREARVAALRTIGGVELAKELARDQQRFPMLDAALRDARHAGRLLRAQPGFSAAVMLAIALGVGANTAVFAVVHAVLWRPLPFPDADRIVRLFESTSQVPQRQVSPLNFLDWRERATTLDAAAAYRLWTYDLIGRDGKEPAPGARVSASLFDVLGVAPVLGRAFRAEEDTPGGPPVAVLSHRFWQTRFASDRAALGRALTLGDTTYTVIGVLPPDVDFPARDTALWTPLRIGDGSHRMSRTESYLLTIARAKASEAPPQTADACTAVGWLRLASLRPVCFASLRSAGVSIARVRDDLDRVATQLASEHPLSNAGSRIAAVPLDEVIRGPVRTPLLLLFGAVICLLLMTAANVAHLLLARATARGPELTLRAALGAGPGRLLRQSLTETLILAAAGGAIGVLTAAWILQALQPLLPATLPRREEVAVDLTSAAFAFAATLALGLICGLAPALAAWRANLDGPSAMGGGLKEARAGNTRFAGARHAVPILLQVMTSVVLLVGALLLLRSFRNVLAVDPGFDAGQVVTLSIGLPGPAYMKNGEFQAATVVDHYERVIDRVSRMPGVEAAGLVNHVPLAGDGSGTRFTIEKRPLPQPDAVPTASYRVVSPTYFAAMRARLLSGRAFTPGDRPGTLPVFLINQAMARRFWPGEDPVGARIRRGGTASKGAYATIVGVVSDMTQDRLERSVTPEIYIPHTQFPWPEMQLVVRTSRALTDIGPELRRELRLLQADQSLHQLGTLEDVLWRTMRERQFVATVLSVFAAIALALAAVGVYGVTAYATSRRTREMAVRIALGARPWEVTRGVVGGSARLILIALIAGLGAAYGVARLIAGTLFGVQPFDPATYVVVIAATIGTALFASWTPVRRALRVDPVIALRAE